MRRKPKLKAALIKAADLLDDYEKIQSLHSVHYAIKADCVKAGISKAQLACLKNVIDLDYYTVSIMLAITERTIHMKKEEETFSHIISDRIMAIAELYSYGYKVFGSRETFNYWMKLPNKYFHKKSPIELMDTYIGHKQVEDEIYRYEVGTF